MEKRKCYSCKDEKPLVEFKKNRALPSGYGYQCRVCSAKAANRYCSDHREERNRYQHGRYLANPEHFRGKATERRAQSKSVTLKHYGGEIPACACCKETGDVFLNIDHINGGGTKHMKEIGVKGGTQFYDWLRKNGFPPGYQILCFNCNFAKHVLGVCPHVTRVAGSEGTPRTSESPLLSSP